MALLDYMRVEQARGGGESEPTPRMYFAPEVTDFLRDNPGMREAARDAAASLMDLFPNGSVSFDMDYDEESGNPKIFFKVRVADYGSEARDRLADWAVNGRPSSARQFSETFVYLVRRG